VTDWTLPSLKAHFDALRLADKEAVALALTAQEKAVAAALEAAKDAATKVETATETRFNSTNEFRGALEDAQKNLASSDRVTALENRVGKNEAELTERRGKAAGAGQLVGYIVGGGGLLLAVAAVLIPMLK